MATPCDLVNRRGPAAAIISSPDSGVSPFNLEAKGTFPVFSIKKLALALTVAVFAAATFGAAPSYASVCDQQGHRVLIKGVWHKVVRGYSGRLIDCGLGW